MTPIQRVVLSFKGICSGLAGGGRLPEDFVRLADVVPSIETDMRYAGSENFTGRPVPGYRAPQCWIRREVAEALAGVAKEAAERGLRLVVYDCYRPQRATQAFIAWAADEADQSKKEAYYPCNKLKIKANKLASLLSFHSTTNSSREKTSKTTTIIL